MSPNGGFSDDDYQRDVDEGYNDQVNYSAP